MYFTPQFVVLLGIGRSLAVPPLSQGSALVAASSLCIVIICQSFLKRLLHLDTANSLIYAGCKYQKVTCLAGSPATQLANAAFHRNPTCR